MLQDEITRKIHRKEVRVVRRSYCRRGTVGENIGTKVLRTDRIVWLGEQEQYSTTGQIVLSFFKSEYETYVRALLLRTMLNIKKRENSGSL